MMLLSKLLALCAVSTLSVVHAADLPLGTGNTNAVCRYVSNGVSNYGERFAKYKTPEACEAYRGLGEDTLRRFDALDKSCYQEISGAVCAVQFSDYEAGATCSRTKDLFFRLIETCTKGTLMAANHADCVSFNRGTRTIDDPATFCTSSYVRVDTGEATSGEESGFEMKTFGRGEQLDCKRIAENYNACMIVAVGLLGYSSHYCSGGGFPAYCTKYPTVVRDQLFSTVCKNLAVPYIIESNAGHGTLRRAHLCDNMYESYLAFLTTRRDDAAKKSEAARLSLESLATEKNLTTGFKTGVISLSRDSEDLDRESTVTLNVLISTSEQNAGFDSQIHTALQDLSVSLSAAETSVARLEYPVLKETAEENIDVFARATGPIAKAAADANKTLVAERNLRSLVDQGGHVAYAQSYGFYPLTPANIEDLRTRIRRMHEAIIPFAQTYTADVSATESPPQSELQASFEADAKDYTDLAAMYTEQISLLRNIH